MSTGTIDDLRTSLGGPVIGPDDAEYDQARKLWNADIDRRPAVIVRCSSAADVVTAIAYARDNDLEIAVRAAPTASRARRRSTTAW